MFYYNNVLFLVKDVDYDINFGNCVVDYLMVWWNLSCLCIKLIVMYVFSGYNIMGWYGWELYKFLKVVRMFI